MKTFLRAIPVAAALILGANGALADSGYSFDFVITQKKMGAENKHQNNITHTKEEWAYKVEIANKSFKDAANIEVKYIEFMKPDMAGAGYATASKVKLKRKTGQYSIPLIKNFANAEFLTDTVTLTGVQLDAGWVWASGANTRSKDALKGLWMRLFIDGQQVAEYINPPSLKDRETWEK